MADNRPDFGEVRQEAENLRNTFGGIQNDLNQIANSNAFTSLFRTSASEAESLRKILETTSANQIRDKRSLNELESASSKAQKEAAKLQTDIGKLERKRATASRAEKATIDQIVRLKRDELDTTQDLIRSANELVEYEKNRSKILDKITDQFEKLKGINDMLSLSFFGLQMLKISEQTANFQKSLLLSADQAKTLRQNFVDVANASNDTFITTNKLIEANAALGKQLGFNKNFGADLDTEFINLTKRVGLTEESAAGFAKASILSGKTLKSTAETASGIVSSVSAQYGIQLDIKDVLNEAGSASAIMLSNFKGSTDALVQGVSQMKALGTSLAQTDQQAASLLDFQSSIENQLQASLLTGRQINLEKARELALNNDLTGVAEELSNQQMNFGEFQQMNRIAQEGFAKSLGLSRDTLADQLLKQAVYQKSQSEIVALYGEEAYKRSQTLNTQEKLNAAIEKMSDIFGNLAAGPLGTIAEVIGKLAENSWVVYSALTAIAGVQIYKLIQQMKTLFAVETMAAFIANPLGATIGAGLAVAAIAGAGTLISNFSQADDLMSGYGDRTLITPQGAYSLNNNDTVIAGTNLFKGNDVYSGPEGALSLGGGADVVDAITKLGERIDKLSERPVIARPSEFTGPITIKQQQNIRRSI